MPCKTLKVKQGMGGEHVAKVPNGTNCMSLMAWFQPRSRGDVKLRARTLGYQFTGSSLQWPESILEDAESRARSIRMWETRCYHGEGS